MNSDGQILSPEEQEKISKKLRDELVPIPEDQLDRLRALEQRQRQEWYRQQQTQRAKQALKSSR